MFGLSKLQIVGLVGFILVLISIPVSFSLVKNSQTLKSKAAQSDKKTASQSSEPLTIISEVPSSSPLSDLEKLLGNVPTSTPSAQTIPTPTINLAFGPILNFKTILEGRPQGNQAAKVFVGIATGSATVNPKYTLTYTVDILSDGSFSGLSLAGFNPGSTYTAYLKGPAQIDAASTFTMSPTETNLNSNQPLTLSTGDLNEDNTINTADYTIAKNLYGLGKSSPNWNERADFNQDGVINNLDLGYIIKNFGKTGASSIWYSPPASGSAQIKGSTGGFWLWVPPNN